ncbi:phosphoribosylglycinamide formyltransferase [Acetivibrio saccincola]|jgi:phosphoribosylglycinamide formyltransferase-1|uniref:Phosphoribosylglycinamide formyltransferase n=3 Tax=Acetivibrio saccincola TaxID=1677857 RepID=A0A2K9E1C3_9FIRM|nr:phosphoribosylglycinamide formyltransferase [Acetivibrio saccincola]AUG57189.1 Phosphoribosylglycinamide formyltransferase [Acetivibrio saccincola]PQQ67173.1 phosphoribosylglycinamide formyltransferase [Acetivibrio saccincola]HOA97716.1 phosphoribosylglycinamide formyltransferase [Acetivibrio saccincola]HQD27885.1 phosphoribosylglycinamide formyltransferase [Acetivibrio saccincola]
MLKIGVLVSGGGTNLQALIDKIEEGYIGNCSIVTVVSSKEGVYALERAKKHGISATCIARKNYADIKEYDEALIKHFEECKVDLIVMAGFLSILGETFVQRFKGRIINIHPSLIPSFCGKGYYGIIPHQKALEYGVKVTGATVHFVELEADSGPIILQKAVYVKDDDTPETLQKRVMEEAEWEILPKAVKLISEGKISVEGRRVRIKD